MGELFVNNLQMWSGPKLLPCFCVVCLLKVYRSFHLTSFLYVFEGFILHLSPSTGIFQYISQPSMYTSSLVTKIDLPRPICRILTVINSTRNFLRILNTEGIYPPSSPFSNVHVSFTSFHLLPFLSCSPP